MWIDSSACIHRVLWLEFQIGSDEARTAEETMQHAFSINHGILNWILLPGNPRDGSVVMVAQSGASKSCWSVNHGAGRAMGRKAAARALDQKAVDAEMDACDILSNCRKYPIDESPDAYKDFAEVLKSVEQAGLARPVATLKARFVIKDNDKADD